jgi:2-polyprenyl-6-methoxyphenol hydroxylase-like FAD-dependent oxidoreductase
MKRTVEIAGGGIAGLTTGLAFAQKGGAFASMSRRAHCEF